MSAFVATDKMPGVYVDEVEVPGGVAGVGTSTVAIVGPARSGPLNTPTRVTSPAEFEAVFGSYISTPMVYATHAVHGFFGNGGSQCYFVRVGTAAPSSLDLMDRSAGPTPTLSVTAKTEGLSGNAITIAVQDAHIQTTSASRAAANLAGAGASNDGAQVDDATGFAAGDIVLVDDGGGTSERATISSTTPTTITFTNNLGSAYAAGTLRIADLAVGQSTFRVDDANGIEPGSAVSVSSAAAENAVVGGVDYATGFLTLESPLANAHTMAAGDPPVQVETLEFTLVVVDEDGNSHNHANLAMDPRHSNYFASAIACEVVDVAAFDPPNSTPPPGNRPAVLAATNLTGGQDDDLSTLGAGHYQAGIDALEAVDPVTLLCVPDRTDVAVQGHMIAHCESMQDRFAILDPAPGLDRAGVLAQRELLASDRGYGALYYPRLRIVHPEPSIDDLITVPPSGHVAGVFANTDELKGVHKAPANEKVVGVLGLERTLTDTDMGILNEQSVNVLRFVRGRGFRVWGARTIATSTQWRYVNVRRLMLFVEESVQEATEFAVFEPNGTPLWKSLERMVSEFLTRLWKAGMFVGTTADQAFRVRIDEVLNPPATRELGQLHIEVRVAPSAPAEFIVFTVIQQPGRPIVDE